MKKPINWKMLLSLASLLLAAGCSSGVVTDGPGEEGEAPMDAGTDAVPSGSAENPESADPSLAQMDPNAPPPDAPPPSDAPPPADPSMQQTASELAALQATDPNGAPPPPMDGMPSDVPPPPSPAMETPPPVVEPVAESTPPVATPAEAAPMSTGWSGSTQSYTVREGETLMQIAFENYGDIYKWRSIYENNKDRISDPNHVPPGTEIQLEKSDVKITKRGKRYLIKSGDTLGTISTDVYGMKSKWKRIWKNNPELIKNPNRIFAGFNLYYTFTKKDAQEKEDALNGGGGETAPAPLAASPESVPNNQGMSPVSPQSAASAPLAGPADPAVAGPRAPASSN